MLPAFFAPGRNVVAPSDKQKRTILLMLSGVAAAARAEDKKAPKPPPLTLELSYIEDPAHPDVFRIGRGNSDSR